MRNSSGPPSSVVTRVCRAVEVHYVRFHTVSPMVTPPPGAAYGAGQLPLFTSAIAQYR